MKELTSENMEQLIAESPVLFIDFWASWCGPCRMFAPVFEGAAEKHPDVVFVKCDTEAQGDVAAEFGIRSIPTLAAFREGILIFKQPGALPAPAFEEVIQKVMSLNMDEVRAEMEKQDAAEE
jgi:thioredoxin 1